MAGDTVTILCGGGPLDGMQVRVDAPQCRPMRLYYLSRLGERTVCAGIDPQVMSEVSRSSRNGGIGWTAYQRADQQPDGGPPLYEYVADLVGK